MSPSSAAIAAWRGASSFADLCELAARFVEGELDLFPGWGAPALDLESDPLAALLARLNRAGWLTLASQPGASGAADRQRAFVFGFADLELARALRALDEDEEIAVLVVEPGARAPDPIEVSEHAGRACVFVGEPAFQTEWELFAEWCGPAAVAELRTLPFACAVDLCWGRDGRLWSLLAALADDAERARGRS